MQLQTATDAAQAARIAADGKAQTAAATQRRVEQERRQLQVCLPSMEGIEGHSNASANANCQLQPLLKAYVGYKQLQQPGRGHV